MSVTHSDSSASTSNDQSELAIKAVDVAGTTPESPIYNSCFADTQILNDYLLVQKEFGDTSPSLAKVCIQVSSAKAILNQCL